MLFFKSFIALFWLSFGVPTNGRWNPSTVDAPQSTERFAQIVNPTRH